MYYNRDLSNIFGFSERTFYRRCKEKNIKKETDNNLMTESEARKIAEALGCLTEFERHLIQKQNGKKGK